MGGALTPIKGANERRGTDMPEECLRCVLGAASLPNVCPFRETTLEAGVRLLDQGETPGYVTLVKSGRVVLTTVDAAGGEWLCSVRGPGTLLGLELLQKQTAPFAAWTLTDAVVCRLEGESLSRWLGDTRSPAGALLGYALSEVNARGRDRLAASGRATPRLARFLLERHLSGERGALGMTHQLIARMLGMRPETLSRSLRKLRDAGAIVETGIRVADAETLAAMAEELDD